MNPPVIQIAVAIVALLIGLWVLHRVSQWAKKRGGSFVTVYEWDYGLRYVNGKFDRVLDAGRYFKWPPTARHSDRAACSSRLRKRRSSPSADPRRRISPRRKACRRPRAAHSLLR